MELDDRIIGFDLRVLRGPTNPWFPENLLKETVETVISVDPMVSPVSVIERREQADKNILGLLVAPIFKPVADPQQYEIAATVAPAIFNKLSEKFGGSLTKGPMSTAADLKENNWTWLGYDVVDLNGLISGLFNLGPYSAELKAKFSSGINRYGLFEDIGTAQKYADVRGAEIPSHNPLYPVCLWKRTR